MSYTAVITHPHDADAMPMWESSGHAEAADALQAAHAHVHETQPDDRTVDEGEGVYGVWSAPTPSMRVATLVITSTADHHPRERSQEFDGEWDYPPSAIQAADCAPGKLYRVKFLDGDWDFTIPGDSPDQPVPEYQARRESTAFGIEWFVVGVSRWTYRDDDLVVLGDADDQAARS